MNGETVLVGLGSGILTGGFVSGIASFRKSKPESAQIMVNAARDVVLIQKGALEDYQRRLDEMERRFDEQDEALRLAAKAAAVALAECNAERRELRKERDGAHRENDELRTQLESQSARIEALEAEVAILRSDTPPRGTPPTTLDQGATHDPPLHP